MKKYIAVLCLLLLLLSACTSAQRSEEGITTVILYTDNVLKLRLDASVYSLDPAYAHTGNELLLARLLYSGLCKMENGEAVGDLALYWDADEDGRIYSFALRDGLRFSDGSELTALDVKTSWERVLRIGAPCAYLFENIKGADAAKEGGELSGVSTDGNMLTVELRQPDYRFPEKLSHIGASVLKRQEISAAGSGFAMPSTMSKYNPLPNGTGLFRLSEWLEGRSMALTANSYYSGEAGSVRRVEIDFTSSVEDALMKLQWSETDAVQNVLPSQVPTEMSYEDLAVLQGEQRGFMFVMLNPDWQTTNNAPFVQQSSRLAFLQLLDAEALNEAVNGGRALTGTGMTEYWYSAYDEVALMRDRTPSGNYILDIQLPLLPIVCGNSAREQAAAAAVSDILAEQGVQCSVRSLGYEELLREMASPGDTAVFICEYNDKGCELYDFFRLCVYGRKDIQLTEDTRNLLDGMIGADRRPLDAEKDGFAKIETELSARGYFKLLWYKQNEYVYNAKLRGLDSDLAQIVR